MRIMLFSLLSVILGSSYGFQNRWFQATSENPTVKIAFVKPQPGVHKVVGTVMDVYTEYKLQGVKVSTEKITTYTDKNGRFELKIPANPKKTTYKISFAKKGYMSDYLDKVAVPSKQEILIGLMKQPR